MSDDATVQPVSPENGTVAESGRSDIPASGLEADAYARWVEKQALSESDAQYMAERMMLQWRSRPSFHLLMHVERGEEGALADTLDSLGEQLYKEWGLSIVSPEAPPQGWQQLANVEWLTIDVPPAEAMSAVVAQSAADWFVCVEAGVRLAPDALYSWADYLNLHPSWRLIYSDEDSIDVDGKRRDPLFRPDANLDLLRSMHYMGDELVVRGDVLREVGGIGGSEGANAYDLALQVFDHSGIGAIGHVPKVLVHRDVRYCRRRDDIVVSGNRIAALRRHLERRRVAAIVEPGLLHGTFHVEYRLTRRPRVTIVIVARGGNSRLGDCVEAILARTSYGNFEVLVTACSEPVGDWDDSRVRILTGTTEIFAQRCNAAARAASGEFLVFIDNEALVGHEDWLDRLVANGLRDEVGVVGARLIDAFQRVVHAGFVLGMQGTVGPPGKGSRLDSAGYLGRLQVTQNLSAVSSACLLISKNLYDSLGGMDEERFPQLFADVDLCLRADERGYLTVWTPFVSLVGGPRLAEAGETAAAEREALYERWLHRLASDPAYNPNLSLVDTAVAVEADVVPGWDPVFRERPRVMAFPLDGLATGHYRVWGPLGALDRAAVAQYSLLPVHGANSRQLRVPSLPELQRLAPDTLLIQHGYFDIFLDWLVRYRAHSRTRIVFGQDDNLLDVPEKNSLKASLIGDLKGRLARALRHCDRLVVTTEPLMDVYRQFIDDIVVVPNNLDGTRWLGLRSLRRVGRKPRVGWAGALQHLGDLDWLEPAVRQLSREVEWVFMGMCPDGLRPYVHEFHEPVAFDDYPRKLASLDLDLAIAPLEMHVFNEGKSDLRLLEYGALGWPVIASDIYPYQNKPVVCLPNDPARWIAAIRERVNDLDALAVEGDRLRDWVHANRLLENNLDAWMNALFSSEVLAGFRAPCALAA